MPSVVLGFAARMEAGENPVSQRVAEQLHAPRVSFGDHVRKIARDRGLPETRKILLDLGRSLVQQDVHDFCVQVLGQASWRSGIPLVIDGVRHLEVLRTLQELVSPAPLHLVYVGGEQKTRRAGPAANNPPHQALHEELEQDPTGSQVASDLRGEADLELDGTNPIELLVQQVVDYATGPANATSPDEWDQKNIRRIELAKKKNRAGLTAAEMAEFQVLQKDFFDYLEAKHPRPPLDLDRLERIEARLRSTSEPSEVK